MSPANREGIVRYSEATIPTRRGEERFVVYQEVLPELRAGSDPGSTQGDTLVEHLAVVVGDVSSAESSAAPILVRIHSECMTGEVFGSLKCECGPQLELALDRIHKKGAGVVIYLRQEGRGIGLGNKLRAYALQETGVDTVDANTQLGFPVDARDYASSAAILQDLGISNIALMTNNPDKVAALQASGVHVQQHAHVVRAGEHNREYLATKSRRLGHVLPSEE